MDYSYVDVSLPKISVATGLFAHWDSVIKCAAISDWLKKAEKERPKGDVLENLKEVAYTLEEAIKKGGKEYLISEDVHRKLVSLFPKREMRFGGNGFNMGNALFLAGMKPIVSYPSRPKELMLKSPEFNVVVGKGLKKPKEAVRSNDREQEHMIIELKNSRHIMTWDPIISKGIFDRDFLRFATNPKNVDVLLLSYAHLMLPKYKKRTDEITDLLKKDRPKIHLELGLGSEESMRYAMQEFSEKNCESWGMNEEECKAYLNADSNEIEDMKEAVLNAIKEYNVDRICVHTPKFAFVVSKYDAARECNSLAAACVLATARTFGGFDVEGARNLTAVGKISKERIGRYSFCLVPCLINNSPKILTGVGDSFAAVQAVKTLC